MPVVSLTMSVKWRPVGGSSSASRARRSPKSVRLDFLDDLSTISPPHFVDKLKNAVASDKGSQFVAMTQRLTKALKNSPDPGPCTYVAQCLEALAALGATPNNQSLGHLVTRSLDELDNSFKSADDIVEAKKLAARIFRDVIKDEKHVDPRLLVRFILALEVQISDVAEVQEGFEDEDERLSEARSGIESFILGLVRRRLYSSAVSLLKHFNLQECTSQEFLVTMVTAGQWELAGQWAGFLGRDSLIFLVEHCREVEQYKGSYRLVKSYDLNDEFPDAYHVYRRSSLRKLVGKGIWDVAENIARDDRVLEDYLIMLALGRNERRRAEALCEAFQLEGYDLSAVEITEIETPCEYFLLETLMDREKVHWIDNAEGLQLVLESLSEAEFVGVDCEWKANRIKGEEPNKTSIIQLASESSAFVVDLLKLSNEAPEELSNCIECIFSSRKILKIGFGLPYDLGRLAGSYPHLKGFQSCSTLIDLETFPEKRATGGLSGLTKTFMGRPLDKSVRMSNWNQRPLTPDQLHYAALDAAILVPLLHHVCSTHSIEDSGRNCARNWPS